MGLKSEEAPSQTIASGIEENLRRAILRAEIKPDTRLNLDALRAEMQVGLTPLREAIMRLVAEGLIESVPKRGYTVTPISAANLEEVCALRLEIEPYALRHSITNGDIEWEASVISSLHRLTKTERIAGNDASLAEWEAANNHFHYTLIERCDMPLLVKIYNSLSSLNDRYRNIYLKSAGVQRDVVDEHTAIADAAVNRDTERACELLSKHIKRSTENILRLIAHDLPGGQDLCNP